MTGARTPRVVVVGSVNVDLVTRVERLPTPGETVLGGVFSRHPGGKGANQAVAAARLGARVALVGRVGEDEAGRRARRELVAAGVDCADLRDAAAPTGTATVIVDRAGENLIAVASGANALLDAEAAARAVGAAAGPGEVVLLGLEVPLAAVVTAAEAAVRAGATVVLDPAPAPTGPLPKRLVASCAVLTPNEHELPAGGPAELIGTGAAAVVVTLGAAGAELHRPGHPPLTRPALPAAVVDTTGAGDAFTAALGWALAGGLDLPDAVLVATAAGAAATEAVGARAGLPTRDELARRLAGRLATTLPG